MTYKCAQCGNLNLIVHLEGMRRLDAFDGNMGSIAKTCLVRCLDCGALDTQTGWDFKPDKIFPGLPVEAQAPDVK